MKDSLMLVMGTGLITLLALGNAMYERGNDWGLLFMLPVPLAIAWGMFREIRERFVKRK